MDVQFDISSIYFGLQTLKELEESFINLSTAFNGVTINSSVISSASLFETAKKEINNATNSTIHNLVTLLENSKKILEECDREAALLFQYYEQGILTEDGKWTAVPLMNQDDYGDLKYSQGTVKSSGCGLTSLCMVASYILGELYTPEDLAAIANENRESNIGKMTTAADYVGVNWVKDPNTSREDLVNYLAEGKMVICLVKGSSHFVLCTGLAEDGQILVNDPYSPFRKDSHKDGYTWNELEFSVGSTWVFDPSQQTEAKVVNDKVTVSQTVLDRLAEQGIDLNAMNDVVPEQPEVQPEVEQPTVKQEEGVPETTQTPNNTTLSTSNEGNNSNTSSQTQQSKQTQEEKITTKDQSLEQTRTQSRDQNQTLKEKMYHDDSKTTTQTTSSSKPATQETTTNSNTSNNTNQTTTTTQPKQETQKTTDTYNETKSTTSNETTTTKPSETQTSNTQTSNTQTQSSQSSSQTSQRTEVNTNNQNGSTTSKPETSEPTIQSNNNQTTQTQPETTTPTQTQTMVESNNTIEHQETITSQPEQAETIPSINENIQSNSNGASTYVEPVENNTVVNNDNAIESNQTPTIETPSTEQYNYQPETNSNQTSLQNEQYTNSNEAIISSGNHNTNTNVTSSPESPIIQPKVEEEKITSYSSTSVESNNYSTHNNNIQTNTAKDNYSPSTNETINSTETNIVQEQDTTLDYEPEVLDDINLNNSNTYQDETIINTSEEYLNQQELTQETMPIIDEQIIKETSPGLVKKEEKKTSWIPGAIGLAAVAATGIGAASIVKKSKKNDE